LAVTDRVDGAGAVEPQHVDGGGRRRDRGIEGVVEATGHDAQRLVQRAVHLVADHDRGDRGRCVGARHLRGRQHRRDHAARMAAAARKAVVAVEVAPHRGVGERGELGQRAARGAEHAGAVGRLGAQREAARDAARLGVERRDRAAEHVDDPPLAGLDALGGEVRKIQPAREVRDPADRCVRVIRHHRSSPPRRPLAEPHGIDRGRCVNCACNAAATRALT
jgi:hypothetical protein